MVSDILPSQSSNGWTALAYVVSSGRYVLCCCSAPQHSIGFCWSKLLGAKIHCLTLCHACNSCHPLPIIIQFQDWNLMHLFPGIESRWNASVLTIFLVMSYRSHYILFHVQSVFTDVIFAGASIPLQSLVRTYLGNFIYQGTNAALFFYFGGGISVSAWTFHGSGLTHCW